MPRVIVFSSRSYDISSFQSHAMGYPEVELVFERDSLDLSSVSRAEGAMGVCVFVNDILDAPVLHALAALGVRIVALRCAGYDRVDLTTAASLGMVVTHVPGYTPYAVAEMTILLLLALSRKFRSTQARVLRGDFTLDGLDGTLVHQKSVGIIGLGEIGRTVASILHGFGCRVQAYDPYLDPLTTSLPLLPLERLLEQSDVVTLHCPLTEETRHMVNAEFLSHMKQGSLLINTARGGLFCTEHVLQALENGHLAGVGIDVYEKEAGIFLASDPKDRRDAMLLQLTQMPQVIVTGHQGFLVDRALEQIAQETLTSLGTFFSGGHPQYAFTPSH